ncbi:holin family protein [Paracoccus spongiarum]|uniref:Holin family protein n=1 Tax=Paracoccus spongiarum TaxID=3064387 RepID=A0ABT9JBP8_9RHOB|nr:holin family protein [Paracoccus sp. 2205BS29-5]MDP5307199.1 holin family protein [Paracoccus sp. 2205BS29-5]
MGMIDRFIGLGQGVTALGSAATGMAEVFTQNATRKMELEEEAYARAITQLGQEFQIARAGFFDSFINGLNRLPRPLLALGTMGLFVYAMVEPDGFGLRMEGLQQVPEPLWWLLGAIVGFYFGAREAHYFRGRVWPARKSAGGASDAAAASAAPTEQRAQPDDDFADNAALRDWVTGLRE